MTLRRYSLLLVLPVLAGCAAERYHMQGQSLLDQGKTEEGLAMLAKASEEAPTQADYRRDYLTKKADYVNQWLTEGQRYRRAGKTEEAKAVFNRVLALDANNSRAKEGLIGLDQDRRQKDLLGLANEAWKAGDTDQTESVLRLVLADNPEQVDALALKREMAEQQAKRLTSEPTLKTSYTKPINLEIRDANVKMMFESLARTTGINFILDKDIRPDLRTTVYLKNASIEDAVDLIIRTSELQRKVLNSNTVLIYPNTPEKLKEYQELVVKAFYLQNADVKQVQNTLKTLLKTKDMVVDEKLNAIVMRDAPEVIRLAEKLIAIHDIAEPEVMLEVEVLEVQRNKLNNIGIQWPNQMSLTALTTGDTMTLKELRSLSSAQLGVTVPSATVNLRRDLSDVNLLANPRIRVRNREKAKVMIGDKVPVVTTTTTATGLVSDNIQYLDVGLKLEVEPDIHLKDDVTIKVSLEVSSIVSTSKTTSGTTTYQLGTRNATTNLRLRDGETQILAGLISDQDRSSASRVPGLGDLPLVGRLFGSQQDDRQKTEIVLSITPRLINNLSRPEASQSEFWSGTENTLRIKPLRLQSMERKADATGGNAGATNGSSASQSAIESNGPSSLLPGARPTEVAAKNVGLTWQGPVSAKVGDTFKVNLRIKADGSLRSLPLQLGIDKSALQVVDVSEGGFFKQNGGNTTFSKTVDASEGKVYVSVIRSDVDGADGEDTVLTLTLRATSAQAKAEINVLAAAPIVQGDAQPTLAMPSAYGVAITP